MQSNQVAQRREQRNKDNTDRGNSMHWCNVADGIPCDMDVGGCELTGACDNQVVSEHVEVLAAEWLCDDKERQACGISGGLWRGLSQGGGG